MRLAPFVFVAVWAAACGSTPDVPSSTIWPTRGWTTSTPEAEGLDGAALAALDREFAAGAHGQVTGMLVVRHGKIVVERS